MPFCPKCRIEYNEGIENCYDCDEPLVDFLDEPTEENLLDEDSFKDWSQLARFTSQIIAEMVVEGLRQKNIPAVILYGAGHFGITGQMGLSSYRPVGGGYSLMVPKEYASEADIEAEYILGDEWLKARI